MEERPLKKYGVCENDRVARPRITDDTITLEFFESMGIDTIYVNSAMQRPRARSAKLNQRALSD